MRQFGLIGYPLGHSFSKKFFEEKFEKEGIKNALFHLFPIPSINDFPKLLQSNPELKGLAVTIPYKQSVMQFLNETDAAAEAIGAVNCIRIQHNNLKGFNTDAIGFEISFQKLLQPHHKKALILGTGGSSKAIAYVLQKLNIPFKYVSRENKENAFVYTDLDKKIMEEYSIIINCSPAGMSPHENTSPQIPYEFLTPHHLLYDLVYNPENTLFMQKGKAKGATVKNGYDMLVLQAEENWKIWNAAD